MPSINQLSRKILNDFKHKLFVMMAHAKNIKINIMAPAIIMARKVCEIRLVLCPASEFEAYEMNPE